MSSAIYKLQSKEEDEECNMKRHRRRKYKNERKRGIVKCTCLTKLKGKKRRQT
jgi:hypothetical protein